MENAKKELLARLADKNGELFSLLSPCTREPYVECDEETFDDKVALYFTADAAKAAAAALGEKKIPATVMQIESRQMLLFFTNLYTMGVNAVQVGSEEPVLIQLEEIVKRREDRTMPDGSVWVENPQLHLTAIYFAQELRKPAGEKTPQTLKDLQEELAADFQKSRFLFALEKEGTGTPMVQTKDGQKYQPVFTDAVEFSRFNRENKFKAVVVDGAQIGKVLDKDARGVILNLMGVNLPLAVNRNSNPKA